MKNNKDILLKKRRYSWLILILFLLTVIAAAYAYKQTKFHQGSVKSNQNIVNDPNKNTIITDYAVIPVQIVPIRAKTVITIPFLPPKNRVEVWLSLILKDSEQINFLMSHPDLNDLNWSYVGNDTYTLFQKEKHFDSVEQFLENIPKDKNIEADPQLITNYPQLQNAAKDLAQKIDFNSVDYILTTFRPFYYENNWSVFKTIVDTSSALVQEDKLMMTLTMAGVSENNPFVFNRIYVDYLQSNNQPNTQQMGIQ